MRKPTVWIVYGTCPDFDTVTREWSDFPLEHYSDCETRDEAEYDALEVWSEHVHGAEVTSIVRYDEAL